MAPQLIASLKMLKPGDLNVLNIRIIAVGGLIFTELFHVQGMFRANFALLRSLHGSILRSTASRKRKQQKE